MLRLGYKASAEQFGPRDLLRFACAAERAGFDSVFVSDHFQPWRHTGGHAPFSMAWLGALGARTSRVLLGTSVLTPTFRYHPSIVAQAFGTLGSLYPGRVILGIGTGEALNDVPATGMVWPPFKERFGRLREAVTLIRKLWSEERVSFAGEFYRTENATIYDRPDEPIPLYISAGGALVAKFVGRAGDGFICTSGKAWPFYREELLPNLASGIAAANRAEDSVERMIEMKVSFDTDRARALRRHAPLGGARARPPRKSSRSRTRARWSGSPTRCRSSARPRAGSSRAILTSRSRGSVPMSRWGSGISSFTRPGRTRSGFSNSMRATCCRACAARSAERT